MKDKQDDGNNNKDQKVETAKQIINRYRDKYKSINPDVLFNLSALKQITSEPKQDNPDAAAEKIKQHLGLLESGETLRQERWRGQVTCPYCNSTEIKRLAVEEQKSQEIYRYRCLSCNEAFNDDSDTKMEGGIPSIHTWMFCWYLLGCTNSVQYIAAKLGLSIATVEIMIRHMQRLFKTEEPLKHFLPFDEWYITHGKSYKATMQHALNKQMEKFRGFSVGQEIDTAEVRRQKNRSKPTPKF